MKPDEAVKAAFARAKHNTIEYGIVFLENTIERLKDPSDINECFNCEDIHCNSCPVYSLCSSDLHDEVEKEIEGRVSGPARKHVLTELQSRLKQWKDYYLISTRATGKHDDYDREAV